MSEGDSVAKSVNITSLIRTVSTTDWKKTPWSSICAPIMMKNPAMMSHQLCRSMPATIAARASSWPSPVAARLADPNPGPAQSSRASAGRSPEDMRAADADAKPCLHPHHAAQQVP